MFYSLSVMYKLSSKIVLTEALRDISKMEKKDTKKCIITGGNAQVHSCNNSKLWTVQIISHSLWYTSLFLHLSRKKNYK